MALNMRTATALTLRTYTGPDKEGVTRTRAPYNGHYLHQASGMQPHPQSGDGNHNIRSLVVGAFSMWLPDLKWSDLEPAEGIYEMGAIKALLDVGAEQRLFGGLNFEWKHFDVDKYTDVVPHWMTDIATDTISFSYTGGTTVDTVTPGTLIYGGTSGARGVFNHSSQGTTGTMIVDKVSGTFQNGEAVKLYGSGTTIATISSAITSHTGTQVLLGQDGLNCKVWEKYILDKMRKLLDRVYREFGHHPWFAAIETPETAGPRQRDGGTTTIHGVAWSHNSTWKWTGDSGAILSAVQASVGNTFLNGGGQPGDAYVLAFGRLARDYAAMHPSVTWIGGINNIPGQNGLSGQVRGLAVMCAPDGVTTAVSNNLAFGGPDILYEFPAVGGINKIAYPMYRCASDGFGFEYDGTAATHGSQAFAKHRHRNSMQHDSHKTAENGGLTLARLWKWGRDYLSLHMIQWNYQKGTQAQYIFVDQKNAISGVGDHVLTASNPPDANGYSNRANVTATLNTYKAIGKKFTTAGTYDVSQANGFPANATGVQYSFSCSFEFRVANWDTQKVLWSSGNLSVVYMATGNVELRNGATAVCTVTNASTAFAGNTNGSTQYGRINFSVGRHAASKGAVADRKIYLYARNLNGGGDGGDNSGAISAYLLGATFSVCTVAGTTLVNGCTIIGRNLAGITSSNGMTREMQVYRPTKPIG